MVFANSALRSHSAHIAWCTPSFIASCCIHSAHIASCIRSAHITWCTPGSVLCIRQHFLGLTFALQPPETVTCDTFSLLLQTQDVVTCDTFSLLSQTQEAATCGTLSFSIQCKTQQSNAKQSNAKQKQNKAKQCKAMQDTAKQCKAVQTPQSARHQQQGDSPFRDISRSAYASAISTQGGVPHPSASYWPGW